nr:RNA-directed DNA polymerase, eukaryota [Tanacetum cinerariifolium]
MVQKVRQLINRWWDIPDSEFDSYTSWKEWVKNLRLPGKIKLMFEGVYNVMWWLLWWYRNQTIFEAKAPNKVVFFDDVITKSFYWCSLIPVDCVDFHHKHVDEEEYDHTDEELYKDVNVKWNVAEHGKERKGDEEKTYVGHDDDTQETTYNPSPTDTEINSMMNIDVRHEEPSAQKPPLLTIPITVIPETSSPAASTVSLHIPQFTPLPQPSTSTPTSTPTPTTETTTSIPALPDFSSLFGFNQRVYVLERELSQFKQVDYSA